MSSLRTALTSLRPDWVRRASIRLQLLAFAAVACLTAVTICCAALLWSDWRLIHEMKRAEVESLTQMLAFNSGAVVTFVQQDSAEELLAALDSQPTITQAILYTSDGELVGVYRTDGAVAAPAFETLAVGTGYLPDGQIVCVEPVQDVGEVVGLLVVHASTSQVTQSLTGVACVALVVLLVSVAAAVVVAHSLAKVITRPILQLAGAARTISADEDVTLRVRTDAVNEIGELYAAFNGMLDRVDGSKAALLEANDTLEDRVRDRTVQLEAEIDERRRTHAQLLQAKDDAEAANRAKSEFLANMSHEIRTPMNAILGFTDLLRRHPADGDPEERDDYLETIHTSGRHLLTLINDILDLSKVESGQMETEAIAVSPHQVIAEAVSVMRVPARSKGLQLDYHWDSPIPQTVSTDPSRFRQLLLNLIGNAVKFTDQGAVTVTARLQQPIDGDGGNDGPLLLIDVIDTGIGIKREKLDEIFDPFAQADSSVTRQYGGTGLGLTISRRLARQLGGDLTVESEEGLGSIFTVSLATGPLGDVAILDGPPTADLMRASASDRTAEPPVLQPSRVLVVEDGETNRRLIRKMLTMLGHEVVLAENGRLGADRAIAERFDIILMDMQMPVLDGYGAAAELTAQGLQTPIIALTAHAMIGDREKCLAAGCVDYLTKPIAEVDLIWKLSDYLPAAAGDATGATTSPQLPAAAGSARPVTRVPVVSASELPLRSILPYDDADYREIIDDFVACATERCNAAAALLDNASWEALKQYAHWLRGTAGTAGFEGFSIPAQKLETAAVCHDAAAAAAAFDTVRSLTARLKSCKEVDEEIDEEVDEAVAAG